MELTLDNINCHKYNVKKAVTERNGNLSFQRVGVWCEPITGISLFYGS